MEDFTISAEQQADGRMVYRVIPLGTAEAAHMTFPTTEAAAA